MIKRKALMLFLAMSLAANGMVIVTWIITNALGYDAINPAYLFKNMVAVVAITGVGTIFGWFYSKNNILFMGSLHFLGSTVTFVLFGLWANWFPPNGAIISTGILTFVVIFFGIWTIHYLYWKNQIQKINRKLSW